MSHKVLATFHYATDYTFGYIYDGEGANATLHVPEWHYGGNPPRTIHLVEDEYGIPFEDADRMDDGRRVIESDDGNDIVITSDQPLPDRFNARLDAVR